MAAITWKNVNGNSDEGVATMLAGAQSGFNAGFDKLAGTLQEYQTGQKAAWDHGKEANVDAFMDRLSQAKTPEEMAALQSSGELDQMLAGYGAQIDRSAVRNALDTRGDFLRQQATNRMVYDNQSRDQREAEAIDNIQACMPAVILRVEIGWQRVRISATMLLSRTYAPNRSLGSTRKVVQKVPRHGRTC